jgi:CysZ protein
VFLIVIGFLVVLIVCYFLFTVFGGLITAPFNENISQITEEAIINKKPVSDLSFWKDAYISIKAEIQKLIFYFAFLILILLINIIPVIGSIISAILGLIFLFYYNAFDFLDYPMTRKRMSFKLKLKTVSSGKMVTYGFGCIAFLLMFLPVVNVFLKPLLVVSGTAIYFERYPVFDLKQ